LLARRLREHPEALELVAGARKAQADLERIHEELRAYAAPMVLERGHHDVAKLWREAWAHLAQRREGRAASLREEIGETSTFIEVDPFRVHQVFRNLLENALDACSDPVEIRIAASTAPFQGRLALRVEMQDNGPGIPPDRLERVFEAFYTTKSRGTGLGMAIVKRIIDAHGGTVELTSNPGKGLKVTMTLPRRA
jgi:signal transduction histidine kinase